MLHFLGTTWITLVRKELRNAEFDHEFEALVLLCRRFFVRGRSDFFSGLSQIVASREYLINPEAFET